MNWSLKKKYIFKHNKIKYKKHKYKEIRLEKSNPDFIVVQHFLAYIHSPQTPNRVRVPHILEASTKLLITFYTWILAPMGSYTFSSSLYSLEDFNTQLTV